jgi:hypothetical protein
MHIMIARPALIVNWLRVRGRKYPWLDLLYGGITTVVSVVAAVLLYYDCTNAAVIVLLAAACAVAVLSVALVIIGPRLFT